MLKTLNIESAKPRKSVVGVGSSRKDPSNKFEPVSKHEISCDKIDDEVDDEIR